MSYPLGLVDFGDLVLFDLFENLQKKSKFREGKLVDLNKRIMGGGGGTERVFCYEEISIDPLADPGFG